MTNALLLDPRVLEWGGYGYLYTLWYPTRIESEVAAGCDPSVLIDEIVRFIRSVKHEQPGYMAFGNSNIPYDNRAFDDETKTLAFVLLREEPLIGGMSWAEVVYGARIEADQIVITEAYFGRNQYSGGVHKEPHGHYRVMVDRIDRGVLSYRLKHVHEKEFHTVTVNLLA